MRVDLPAPFSPQIAWILPRATSRVTSESALTPGKVFVIDRISRMFWVTFLPTSLRRRGEEPVVGSLTALPTTGQMVHLVLGSGSLETELRSRPVAGVDQRRLDVLRDDRHRAEQVRGNDLDAVVVGLDVVDLRLAALEQRAGHL